MTPSDPRLQALAAGAKTLADQGRLHLAGARVAGFGIDAAQAKRWISIAARVEGIADLPPESRAAEVRDAVRSDDLAEIERYAEHLTEPPRTVEKRQQAERLQRLVAELRALLG